MAAVPTNFFAPPRPPALATQVPGQSPEIPSPMPKSAPPRRWAAPT